MIKNIIAAALAVVYLLYLFLWEEKESHFGPFPSRSERVRRITIEPENDYSYRIYTQPVTLIDRIRSLFGAYEIMNMEEGKIWEVRSDRMEVWECPKCLSFWMVLPFTFMYFLKSRSISKSITFHLATAGLSYLLFNFSDELIAGKNFYEKDFQAETTEIQLPDDLDDDDYAGYIS